ncbi:transposase [Streptomyces sp. 2A115]|uniref:transposase n=1 Tax=Streptomyces sp. 2A115 TaxID=3457439 RepID=UPI003FCF8C2F
MTRLWSHDRAHAFFSRARWNAGILGISLSHLIVRQLLAEGAVLTVAVDDTLFKQRGKKVFGAAWQHDGAAQGPKPVGRGTCIVVVGPVVELPVPARPVCLPVTARLWRPGQELSKCRHRRLDAPLPGRLPPRPAPARRRGRRLPRQIPAPSARQRHLHHPAARHRRALRPRPTTNRQARPARPQGRTPGHREGAGGHRRLHIVRGQALSAHRHRVPRRGHLPVVRPSTPVPSA